MRIVWLFRVRINVFGIDVIYYSLLSAAFHRWQIYDCQEASRQRNPFSLFRSGSCKNCIRSAEVIGLEHGVSISDKINLPRYHQIIRCVRIFLISRAAFFIVLVAIARAVWENARSAEHKQKSMGSPQQRTNKENCGTCPIGRR